MLVVDLLKMKVWYYLQINNGLVGLKKKKKLLYNQPINIIEIKENDLILVEKYFIKLIQNNVLR